MYQIGKTKMIEDFRQICCVNKEFFRRWRNILAFIRFCSNTTWNDRWTVFEVMQQISNPR